MNSKIKEFIKRHSKIEWFSRMNCGNLVNAIRNHQCSERLSNIKKELMEQTWRSKRLLSWCLPNDEIKEFYKTIDWMNEWQIKEF